MSDSQPFNTQYFLFRRDAFIFDKYLIPEYATKTQIKYQRDKGFYILVWWNSGVIAPLTVHEYRQAYEGLGSNAPSSAI